MSNQYFNFYYSPIRQGFDSSTWRTLLGSPAVSNNRLILSDAAIIHYGDILRGDAIFNINIAAPSAGLSKKFGFYQPGLNAYAYFNISGAGFTADCSDGTNTTSVSITWQSAWTNTATEFRVKWEAGMATFFVGGVQQAVINDISVSGNPMSIYLTNNSNDSLFLSYIDVKSIQSYMMSEGNENSSFEDLVYESDQLNITEAVTIYKTEYFIPVAGSSFSDSITLSESVTVQRLFDVTVSDSLTTTESISFNPVEFINVNDALTATDVITVAEPVNMIDVSDSLTLTESITQAMV